MFHGLPYAKIKLWADLPLKDSRVKTVTEKRVLKTFRLKPETVKRLKIVASEMGCTETEVIERKILKK